ncbi:glutamate 5-kinase [Megasphaera sp.]|uniref:glutamate 5-kinase n=1 Tax=Megasphaera sp. TaxID=2023260 RepID=UPI00307930F6
MNSTSRDFGQKKRIVVKVGSSTISHATGKLNYRRMEHLVRELADLQNQGKQMILVSSGATNAGMAPLHMDHRPRSIREKQALAAVGQGVLMHTYERLFREYGQVVGQVLLTRMDSQDRSKFMNSRNALLTMLDMGVIPIINENDVVAVDEYKIGDNDTLSAMVSGLVDADLLILLSDIDGLYTDNPRTHDKHIYEIAGDAGSSMGTGGMYTKIQAASIATAADVDMVIASGSEDGIISRICAGEEVGTLFKAKETPLHSKKRWLVSGSKAQGRIVVDQGCRNAIIDHGSSLLPVGITAVEGIFDEGDIVSVVYDGLTIAKGISNYSSVNINAIKGLQSADIPKVLGHNGIYEEVIHRDNLVAMY